MLTREVFHIREASVQSLRERTRSSIANPFVKISCKCQIIRKSPQEFCLIKSKIIQRLSQIESRPKFCIKIYFYHVLLKINFAATIWRETLPRANIWQVNHDVARTTTIRATCRLFQPVLARTTSKKKYSASFKSTAIEFPSQRENCLIINKQERVTCSKSYHLPFLKSNFPIHQPGILQVDRTNTYFATECILSDGRLNSCLQAGRILKMLKYLGLVLLCNLVISVLGEFQAEEPLDRGRYWVSKLWDQSTWKQLRFKLISSTFLDSNFIGWGETIEWKTFEDGLKAAKQK